MMMIDTECAVFARAERIFTRISESQQLQDPETLKHLFLPNVVSTSYRLRLDCTDRKVGCLGGGRVTGNSNI